MNTLQRILYGLRLPLGHRLIQALALYAITRALEAIAFLALFAICDVVEGAITGEPQYLSVRAWWLVPSVFYLTFGYALVSLVGFIAFGVPSAGIHARRRLLLANVGVLLLWWAICVLLIYGLDVPVMYVTVAVLLLGFNWSVCAVIRRRRHSLEERLPLVSG